MNAKLSKLAIAVSLAIGGQQVYAQTTELEKTVVSSESRRGIQVDTAASKTVIDFEEIESRQATVLGELLNSIPNTSLLNSLAPQGGGISIRGLGAQSGFFGTDGKVAVVIDGVVSGAEEIYRNGSALSADPELFKRVTVTRGPSNGFSFSGGSVGGTIEFETKDGSDFIKDDKDFAFRQKFGYESNGKAKLSSSILAFAPNEDFDALLSFSYREADDREDGDGNDIIGTEFESKSILAKVNFSINEDSGVTFSYMTTEIPERDVFYDVWDPAIGAFFGNVNRDTTDTTAYLEYKFAPADNDVINLTARVQYKEEEIALEGLGRSVTSSLLNADHLTETLAFRLANQAKFSTDSITHTLTTGIEIGERERTAISVGGANDGSAPGGTDEYISLYIVDDIAIGESLTITPQLRFEKQTLTSENNGPYVSFGRPVPGIPDGTEYKEDVVTGAVSLRYEITESVAVFGTVAKNANLPILDDLRSSTNINQTEKSDTVEGGLSYDGNSLFADGDALRAKLTVYQTEIEDITTYSGLDEVELDGVELEASYASPAIYLDFAYGNNEGEITGIDARSRSQVGQPFSQATGKTAQFTVGKRFLENQVDVNLELYRAFANDRTTSTSGARAPSEAYTLVSLSAGYLPVSGPLEGAEIRLSAQNLGDKEYRAYGNAQNSVGRTIRLSVAYNF